MSNNKNFPSGRCDYRPIPAPRAGVRLSKRSLARCVRRVRRAWRTHAYRDSQVIFYGHDLPSEFRGRRR